ncbi:gluconokinase [Spiractinospora alimapuensis]|uniref:gluconokinase n=1 Tax=Spiractinospora alimapuensis TaxID=2820884 RepID=UPI001F351502|nr:gluconokinase, GntK/IdnK-type [Spiractinospora alimapuensis]
MHIIVMGVAGCGKSTVGRSLSDRFGLPFAEADDFHPTANRQKMESGQPLDDADRDPWLDALAAWLAARRRAGGSSVMACSALRRRYRDRLRLDTSDAFFLHLRGDYSEFARRMAARDHFMPPELLASQFATLEELHPDEAGLTVDASWPVAEVVRCVARRLRGQRDVEVSPPGVLGTDGPRRRGDG